MRVLRKLISLSEGGEKLAIDFGLHEQVTVPQGVVQGGNAEPNAIRSAVHMKPIRLCEVQAPAA